MTCPSGKFKDDTGGTDVPWIDTKMLAPIRKNIRGIYGVDHDITAVTDILIFGLKLY